MTGIALAALAILSCCTLGTAGSAPAGIAGGLFLKNLQSPAGSKIFALEIHMSGGVFDGVSGIPSGWRIAVDNGPGWSATLEAQAKPGAAALDEAATDGIDLQVIADGRAGSKLEPSGSYRLITSQGQEKHIPLDSYNFDFEERYSRHRLR